MIRKRTALFIIAAAAMITAPLFAGGTPEESAPGESAPADSAQPSPAEAFPRTIEHKFGTVTIPAQPRRVVSVGCSEHDVLLALGVIPVGVRDWYGNQPYATWPWAQDALGSATPEIIGSGALDMEAVVALQPDLIVGVSSGMSAEEYDLLSRIAPTLAQPGEYIDYGTPWDEQTLFIGRALGLEDKAETVVSELKGRMQQIKNDNPAFIGASAAVAFLFQNSRGAYASQDTRSRILAQLGFKIPERYDELAGDSFYISISDELIELLDTDVVLWVTGSADGLKDIRELPLRDTTRAYREGRELLLDQLVSGAFSFASPLSISYVLDILVPGLTAAVDGDPATKVPENLR